MGSNARSAAIAELLLAREPPPPLSPGGVYDSTLTARIDALAADEMNKALLHLLNDDLQRVHAIAQSMEGDRTADYLHAIVHRREGDYGNSKYWLGRAQGHPVLARVFGGDEGASTFVDRCRAAGGAGSQERELEEIQRRELTELLAEMGAKQ
jgi:hypothetical protein